MAVTIRLKRVGTKGKPFYKVVAVDLRKKRDGKVLEYIGTYSPAKSRDNFNISIEKIDDWLKKGAVMSETVASFYRKVKKS